MRYTSIIAAIGGITVLVASCSSAGDQNASTADGVASAEESDSYAGERDRAVRDVDMDAVQQTIDRFHDRFNDRDFAAIYLSSHPVFREQVAEEEFLRVLDRLHTRFGAFERGFEIGGMRQTEQSQDFYQINYRSTFANETIVEQFVFQLEGGETLLAGYHTGPVPDSAD